MSLTATLFIDEDDPQERRTAPRRSVGQETTLRRAGVAVDAVLHDLSATGASIETTAPLASGSVVTIGLPGVGRVSATVVSTAASRFGCRFAEPLASATVQRAFAENPVVTMPVVGEGVCATHQVVADDHYPGVVRLGLPIGGAILGWGVILHFVRLAFS